MAMNPRRGGFGRALGAFVLGATTGSIAALLYAPASGEVTRRRIRTKIRVLQTTTAREFQRTQARLAKQARQLRAAAVERVGQTREWVMERLPLANGRHPANHRAAHSA